ncbi:MAG: hypothetical protein LBQ66_16630, partial [Planctomycetaceae bacterium]|nr:hypothetical protein [Planctomycetaceae bacterium]
MKNNTPTQYVQFDDNNYYQDNNDPKVTRKSYSCARSCAVGCLVLVVLVTVCGLLGYFLLLKGEPLIVATETTIITTPLKTDGKSVDFFQPIQKILEPQDKTKENGFKLVVAAYGKDFLLQHNPHINQDWIYDEICKQLELDPNQLPTHVYEAPKFEYREIDTKKLQAEIEKLKAEIENKKSENDYKEKKNEIERKQKALDEVVNSQYDLSKLEREPWSLQEYPKMQLWLDKVDDGLDIVQKAAMHDVFFVPMTRKSDQAITVTAINIPLIEQLQPLVRGLRTRGMLWIGEGDYQKAWNDILAAMRLERQLIHPQFSDDIPDETKQITINNIAKYSQNWSTELLNKAIADLDNLPEPKKRDELLTVVQFLTIDIFAEAHDASKLLEKL